MGWLAKAIDAGHEHRNSLDSVAEGLFVDIGDTRAKRSQFWMLLALSSAIAAGGVVGDSTPAVIGAMIVAPLATPIYGVALATVIGDSPRLRYALRLLATGIVVNIAIGVLAGMLLEQRLPLDANPQIVGRTSPSLLDLIVALATGAAGSFALSRRDVSNILAGVAIAISLVPVLAVVGITLGSGRLDLAWGAMLLFLTNVAAILVAGTLVFRAAGYHTETAERDPKVARRARRFIIVFLVALLVPLGAASVRTMFYEAALYSTSSIAAQWVDDTGWTLDSVRISGNDVVITVIGKGEPPNLGELRTDVRTVVPDFIPVVVAEKYGKETKL